MAIEQLAELTKQLITELQSLAEKNGQMPAGEEASAMRDAIKERIRKLKEKLEEAQKDLEKD